MEYSWCEYPNGKWRGESLGSKQKKIVIKEKRIKMYEKNIPVYFRVQERGLFEV